MATTTNEKRWYVVRAVSGQESKIKDYIKSEISRFGYESAVEDLLVPTVKVISFTNEDASLREYILLGSTFKTSFL